MKIERNVAVFDVAIFKTVVSKIGNCNDEYNYREIGQKVGNLDYLWEIILFVPAKN